MSILARLELFAARQRAAWRGLVQARPQLPPPCDACRATALAISKLCARVTSLTLSPGLPRSAWSVLCEIDSDMRQLKWPLVSSIDDALHARHCRYVEQNGACRDCGFARETHCQRCVSSR
jgi:hypothetical protein